MNYSELENLISQYTDKVSVSGKVVKNQLVEIKNTLVVQTKLTPHSICKYDIIRVPVANCLHYAIVVKVFDEESIVLALNITSSNSTHFVVPNKSRLFKDGFISVIPTVATKEFAISNFIGIYDNPKEIDEILKFSKGVFNTLIFK